MFPAGKAIAAAIARGSGSVEEICALSGIVALLIAAPSPAGGFLLRDGGTDNSDRPGRPCVPPPTGERCMSHPTASNQNLPEASDEAQNLPKPDVGGAAVSPRDTVAGAVRETPEEPSDRPGTEAEEEAQRHR